MKETSGSRPYVVQRRGGNPGGNKKGQTSRAKSHHKGPMQTGNFLEDGIIRSKTFAKRHRTLIKKVQGKICVVFISHVNISLPSLSLKVTSSRAHITSR